MNEREIAKKIAGYLDRGTADLKAGTAYKLQLARQKALAQLSKPRRAPELVLAGAGGGTLGGGRRFFADVRIWVGMLGVVGGILSIQYWQPAQQVRAVEETDAPTLSDGVPPGVASRGGST